MSDHDERTPTQRTPERTVDGPDEGRQERARESVAPPAKGKRRDTGATKPTDLADRRPDRERATDR